MQKVETDIQAKVREILEDRDSKDWYNSLGQESTKETYPPLLAEYLLYRKMTVKELIRKFKSNPLAESKKLQVFVNYLKNDLKRAPKTINNFVAAIRSRLSFDGIEIKIPIKIGNVNMTPTIQNERIPSKDELRKMFNTATLRAKVVLALIAFLGLRFKTIGGLVLADFPEMIIDNSKKTVTFSKVPTKVNIRGEISKNGLPYFSFLIERGCNYIKDSLEERIRNGEILDLKSRVVILYTDETSLRKLRKTLSEIVKRVFEKTGFPHRPYVLRSYFSTVLDNSNVQHNRQKFYTGHKGDIQMTYTLRKQIQDEMVNEMRNQFKEVVEPKLDFENSGNGKDIVKGAFKRFAEEIGVQVKEDQPLEDTISEIAKVYKAAKEDLAKRSNNGKQRMIKEDELNEYLEEGWELVNVLPSGKLVVKQIT